MNYTQLLRYGSLVLISSLMSVGASAQVRISPNAAAPTTNKAIFELNDLTRGFLAPRVVYAQRPPNAAPVPANSLLIYQTDSSVTTGEPKGFYYWDATVAAANKWVHVGWGSNWKLGGNSGTNPATDFIGTTNLIPLDIRTNGITRMRVNTGGQVQIGTTGVPNELMEVNGAVKLTGASAAVPTEGAIRFNPATGAHEGYVNNPLAAPQIQYVGWYQLENAFKVRVKQRYKTTPTVACQYPLPVVVPAGATAGSWPTIDLNGAAANPTTAATLETPFSTFWEDGRHQYLYQSADLQALNICPNTNVKGVAFQTAAAGAFAMRNIKISMKNTVSTGLNDFEYTGLLQCYSNAGPLTVVNGWNAFAFGTNWQWLGPGINMIVEYCFDDQDWTSNTPVYYESTGYNAMYGLYCDACGHPTFGSTTCYYTGPCNATQTIPPAGVSQITPGVLCTGWGWNGLSGGGCAWTSATSLTTCDGTFQYQGAQSAAARRPLLKLDAQIGGTFPTYPNSSYLLAQEGVMIGSPAWAASGTSPNYLFKGPGTISAESSVWGGTVLLSDHVFDKYYDGTVKPEDAARAAGYRHYSVEEMADYVEAERHLPTMDGRQKWTSEGEFSLDKLTNQLWVTVEEQSLYIKELNERMDALQQFLVEKRLKELRKKH